MRKNRLWPTITPLNVSRFWRLTTSLKEILFYFKNFFGLLKSNRRYLQRSTLTFFYNWTIGFLAISRKLFYFSTIWRQICIQRRILHKDSSTNAEVQQIFFICGVVKSAAFRFFCSSITLFFTHKQVSIWKEILFEKFA